MLVFGYYRIWMGFIPLIISLQFAWRASEHKMPEDSQADLDFAKTENISSVDNPVLKVEENITLAGKTTSAREKNDELVDKSFMDVIMESAELGKLLLVNFGLHGRLALINMETVDKSGGKIATDKQNYFESLDWPHLVSSALLNLLGLVIFWYLRPVITSCGCYTLRKLISPFRIGCSFLSVWVKKLGQFMLRPMTGRTASEKDENNIICDQDSSESVVNIKDPESITSSKVTVDSQSESSSETSAVDEKKYRNGPEERQENDLEEWLEDSLIEGGIQTFRSFEADDNKYTNNNITENYLQVSQRGNSSNESKISEFKTSGKFKTSTPDNSATSVSNASSWSSETGVYTPLNLRKYLYDRYDKTRELGLSLDKGTEEPCVSNVEEQKRQKPHFEWHFTDQSPSRLEDFVEATKTRIRNRLMNMSHV